MHEYARIEARYYPANLMDETFRRVLNLTYAWLFDLVGGTEVWEKEYAHIFDRAQGDDSDYVDIPVDPGSGSLRIGGVAG